MGNIKFKLSIKKTTFGFLAFLFLNMAIKFGLVRNESKFISLTNRLICNSRVYKFKIDKGRWRPLSLDNHEITLENGINKI